jgi:parvulin-like peptidyl-prolyl isomerase
MKKALLAAVVLAVVVPALILAGCSKSVPSGAIAQVGSGTVTQQQFNEIWSEAQAQYKSQGVKLPAKGSAQYNQIRASIINYLVQNEVINQLAAKSSVDVTIAGKKVSVPMKVAVTAKDVQARLAQIKKQVGGEKKFQKLLTQQGYTLAALMAQLKASMVQSKVQQNVVGKITVTPQQLQTYYTKHLSQFQQAATVDARHVLVKTKAEAEHVRALLAAKNTDANWKAVASKYSIDTGTKSTGGELGSFPRGRMVKPFENAAFSLKVNEISQPVHTQYGWHVIEVTKKTPASKQTFAQAKATIQQTLLATQQQTVWQAFLKQAIKDAGVAYAAGYNPDALTASPSAAASASATPSPSATQ